ncbi:MAG: RsmD family RNA methyltransferase [Prevotellaceae bacterium]|jgi:23S rRNA (cytosine1962-C5)-methyltransferase|nr:RsmD family RNA methyltransferase [Prevotellaceae bacterium]
MNQTIQILSPEWSQYELIDCGNFEKLERFGKYVLRRPEPKSVWNKSMKESEWQTLSNIVFKPGAGFNKSGKENSGTWSGKLPEQWTVAYNYKTLNMRLNAALTSFKHVGIFPEQAPNWNYIYDSVKSLDLPAPRILNLFAYTGAASLSAKAAGADVTHLDSVRQVVSWARRNMESSGMDGLRWVVDDAMRFVKREAKRGNRYNGIILDPPAYGHGTDGEKWKLEDNILEMMLLCRSILTPEKSFIVLNLYSNGFSAIVADTLVTSVFPDCREKTSGELALCDRFNKRLPLSVFSRLKF